MEILEFQQIHELPQLPAASAIVCFGRRLFLIGDSSQYVHLVDEAGRHACYPLLPGACLATEPLEKKQKPDFEGLVLDAARAALLVLPSGSKQNRFLGVRVDLADARYPAYPVDFSPLYSKVMACTALGEQDINIEGGGSWGPHRWFLLNRGNGPQARNLLVILEGSDLPCALPVAHHRLDLPALDGVVATLTDGCIVGEQLYVVASAEGSAGTYSDGEVAGSLIARYDLADFSLRDWCRLPGRMKFEGVSVLDAAEPLSLVLCSDNDDPSQAGTVYRAVLRT